MGDRDERRGRFAATPSEVASSAARRYDPGPVGPSRCHMKRTTIFIEEGIERKLRLVARRRGRSVAAVVRDAIAREVAAEARPPLSFVGVGDSGRRDVAERHEELLWKTLAPHPLEAVKKPSAAPPRSRHRRRAAGKPGR